MACLLSYSFRMHSFHALVCQASYCMTRFGKLWEEWKTVDSRYVCVCSEIYTVLYRYANPKPENYRFLEQHLMGMLLTGVSSSSTSHPQILSTKLKIHLHRRNDFCSQILSTCWKPFEIAGSRSIVILRYVTCSLSFICNHSSCCITQQNNGKGISWSHLTELYHRDTSPGMGIRIVPKLKFEHISLTSFSKMHVDLAAQVRILWLPPTLSYQILIFMCITLCRFSAKQSPKCLSLLAGKRHLKLLALWGWWTSSLMPWMCTTIHMGYWFQMPYTSSKDMRLKVHALLISVYMFVMWNYFLHSG